MLILTPQYFYLFSSCWEAVLCCWCGFHWEGPSHMLGWSWCSGSHPQTPQWGLWWGCHPCSGASSPRCCRVCSAVRPCGAHQGQRGFRGGLLSQLFPHFLHREALWDVFTSLRNTEGNGLSSQPSFQGLETAQLLLAPAHSHHKMAPRSPIRLPKWRPRPRRVVDLKAGVIPSSIDEHLRL